MGSAAHRARIVAAGGLAGDRGSAISVPADIGGSLAEGLLSATEETLSDLLKSAAVERTAVAETRVAYLAVRTYCSTSTM
jgi:hypothetical protein